MKPTIVAEFAEILPKFLDTEVAEFIGRNYSVVECMTEEQLRELKATINQMTPKAVSQVISKLDGLDDWFRCGERSYYGLTSSPMWSIIQSVGGPIREILKPAGFTVHEHDLSPQPYGGFTKQRAQSKVDRIDEEYRNNLKEYCEEQEQLLRLEEERKREAASQRWRSVT